MTFRTDPSVTGGELGPALQVLLSAAALGLTGTVGASGEIQSGIIEVNGWQKFAVGLKSTQGGVLSVQRFLDLAGTVPQGAAVTATLVGGTANVVNIGSDGAIFTALQVTVTNTGASVATLSNVQGVLQAN